MKSTHVLGMAAVSSLALGALLYRPAAAPAMQQEPGAAATGQQIAGISCDAQEGNRIHIHQHLVILDHGREVHIPENVGQPAGRRCLYWLHTHTPDGIIHIEAPQNRTFTLGDFFKIWGQPLSHSLAASAKAAKGKNLKVWVNGHAFTGDPATIPLNAHADVVIEAGPPFPKPPKFTQWGKL